MQISFFDSNGNLLRYNVKNRIRQFRLSLGYSQDKFCQLACISKPTLQDYELNRQQPGACNLFTILFILECSFDALFYLEPVI